MGLQNLKDRGQRQHRRRWAGIVVPVKETIDSRLKLDLYSRGTGRKHPTIGIVQAAAHLWVTRADLSRFQVPTGTTGLGSKLILVDQKFAFAGGAMAPTTSTSAIDIDRDYVDPGVHYRVEISMLISLYPSVSTFSSTTLHRKWQTTRLGKAVSPSTY